MPLFTSESCRLIARSSSCNSPQTKRVHRVWWRRTRPRATAAMNRSRHCARNLTTAPSDVRILVLSIVFVYEGEWLPKSPAQTQCPFESLKYPARHFAHLVRPADVLPRTSQLSGAHNSWIPSCAHASDGRSNVKKIPARTIYPCPPNAMRASGASALPGATSPVALIINPPNDNEDESGTKACAEPLVHRHRRPR